MKSILILVLMMHLFAGSYDVVSIPESHSDVYGTKPQARLIYNADGFEKQEMKGYIFLGDSRTVGLNNICSIDEGDNIWVVAKVGQGYNWLVDNAEDEIDAIVNSNLDIKDWVLVSNLGVNDLDNERKYEEWYSGVLEDFDLKIMSVNPTDGDYEYMYDDIISFNDKIQDFCIKNDVDYINTYDAFSFGTVDGLHYNVSTYIRIRDYIFKEIGL